MEKNDITFRAAELRDRRGVLKLIENAYQCVWDEAYLEWKYDKCPFGHVVTWIAESQGTIIGMRSMRPLIMERNGAEHKVALLFDLAVHPDFRRKGIFSRLVDFGSKWTADHGYEISITFPNKRSSREYQKRKEWIQLGSLNLISKPLNLSGVVRKKIGTLPGSILTIPLDAIQGLFFSEKEARDHERVLIKCVDKYPEGIGKVALGLSDRFKIKRNKRYLDWRYCENPRIEYKNFVAFNRVVPRGFVVGTVRDLMGLKLGFIADIAGEKQVLDLLFHEMCRFFRSKQVDMIGITLSKNNPVYERLIQKSGLIRVPKGLPPKSFLMFACFHKTSLCVSPLDTFENWFMTWGDWDVLEGAGVSLS